MTSSDDAKPAQPSRPPGGPYKRSARNLLIERAFQIKYTSYVVILTLGISLPLGLLLYQQASAAVRAGDEAVQVGSDASEAARLSVDQARILNTRLEMEAMLHVGAEPDKAEAVKRANKVETDKIEARSAEIATWQATLQRQRDALATQRAAMLLTLGGALVALVIFVGLLGLLLTHRVAGPIYRMRLLFAEVGEGRFSPHRPLRKADELQGFFAEFSDMVEKLRARQRAELSNLDEAIKRVEAAGADPDSIADLRVARDAIRTAIARSIPPPKPTP